MSANESIRLFVDAHVFDGPHQGTRTFIKEIYSIISQKKEILLFFGAFNIDNLKTIFDKRENVFFIKYKSPSSLFRLVYDIPAIIKKYKIDFAHFQYISPLTKKCKYIVTTHDVIFEEYPKEFSRFFRFTRFWMYRQSALKANIITTVSNYSKMSIIKYFGIKPDLIHIIPNGINPAFFEPYDKQESKKFISMKFGFDKFILYVSRVEPRKNHFVLLSAYLDLRLYSKGYHLVLLGHKSISVPEFDALIAKLPGDIRHYILIISDLNDEYLLRFYQAATLFVYPSKAEGFGIPPLEAGALKIPVICSNASALKEFSFFGAGHINPDKEGLLKNAITAQLTLPTNENLLNQVAEIIRNDYSWTRSAEHFYSLIKNPPSE
jgi:glycosyltransferase involved in cell wall biosynthesis